MQLYCPLSHRRHLLCNWTPATLTYHGCSLPNPFIPKHLFRAGPLERTNSFLNSTYKTAEEMISKTQSYQLREVWWGCGCNEGAQVDTDIVIEGDGNCCLSRTDHLWQTNRERKLARTLLETEEESWKQRQAARVKEGGREKRKKEKQLGYRYANTKSCKQQNYRIFVWPETMAITSVLLR